MKSIAFLISTRLDDHEGRAEEGVGVKGAMLMGGREKRTHSEKPGDDMKKESQANTQ